MTNITVFDVSMLYRICLLRRCKFGLRLCYSIYTATNTCNTHWPKLYLVCVRPFSISVDGWKKGIWPEVCFFSITILHWYITAWKGLSRWGLANDWLIVLFNDLSILHSVSCIVLWSHQATVIGAAEIYWNHIIVLLAALQDWCCGGTYQQNYYCSVTNTWISH